MNGPDHYREAEQLLDEAASRGESDPAALWCLELAKVHTALAHVAATALTRDGREWLEVAGRRLGNTSPALPAQARARNCRGRRAQPPRPDAAEPPESAPSRRRAADWCSRRSKGCSIGLLPAYLSGYGSMINGSAHSCYGHS